MRADSAILQRLIHMTCWFTPLILRLGANQHLAHPGDIVFRHACAGIVSKRLGSRYCSGRSTDWLKTSSTLSVFMKLSALALSYGLPRRPMEPVRPCFCKAAR